MRLTLALPPGALLGGLLTQRLGPALAAGIGFACAGLGFIAMSQWGDNPSFLMMTLPLLTAGLGFGLVIAPLNAVVLDAAAEAERATVASLLTVVRLVGALVGVALLTSRGLSGFYAEAGRLALDDPRLIDLVRGLEIDSFHDAFIVTAAVCFLVLLPCALLRRQTAATRL